MATRATFVIEVELERESGKFASRDELIDEIKEWLEDANQGTVDGVGADGDSVYEVTEWSVS